MKRRTSLISIFLALALLLMPAVALAYDSKLVLENKDSNWNEITGDGIKGVVEYDSTGEDFSYGLFAKGLTPDTDYSLIYYADPWPGDNPGALIAESTTNSKGKIPRWDEGAVDLGMNLPDVNDANYPDGAKLWLVPSADYDSNTNSLTAWNPENYLFERKLITYTKPEPAPEPEPEVDDYEGGAFVVTMFHNANKDFTAWANGGWNNPDRTLRDDVSYEVTNGGYTLFLEIPDGTHMSFPNRPGTLVTSLNLKVVDSVVKFIPTAMDFSKECTLTVTYPDGVVEVITFTKIRGGLPQ